jgi:L-2-hydroxyglutarate oxidase LhgO
MPGQGGGPARPKFDTVGDLHCDVVVVGGGIVGLATVLALSGRLPDLRLAVLEKEPALGLHQTSRNSGVIHSGIYYRPGSHKARLCVEGAGLLRAFCVQHGVRIEERGKVIVATGESELARLDDLYRRGLANGVRSLARIGPQRLREIEPHAAGIEAIHSPHTACVDFGQVAYAMAGEARRRAVEIRTGAGVTAITREPGGLVFRTAGGDVRAKYLVNCAGLHADAVARMAGASPDVHLVPFRGEYYLIRPERRDLVRGLIYPVPDPAFPFLGVHFTRTVHGDVEAGPNAVLAFAREGYSWTRVHPAELISTLAFPGFWRMARRYWRTGLYEVYRSLSRRAFVRALQRLVPDLRPDDVTRGGAGVRAQAVSASGVLVDDFSILETPGAVHVLNAPSPAATASLAIGRHVAGLAIAAFGLRARPGGEAV